MNIVLGVAKSTHLLIKIIYVQVFFSIFLLFWCLYIVYTLLYLHTQMDVGHRHLRPKVTGCCCQELSSTLSSFEAGSPNQIQILLLLYLPRQFSQEFHYLCLLRLKLQHSDIFSAHLLCSRDLNSGHLALTAELSPQPVFNIY